MPAIREHTTPLIASKRPRESPKLLKASLREVDSASLREVDSDNYNQIFIHFFSFSNELARKLHRAPTRAASVLELSAARVPLAQVRPCVNRFEAPSSTASARGALGHAAQRNRLRGGRSMRGLRALIAVVPKTADDRCVPP